MRNQLRMSVEDYLTGTHELPSLQEQLIEVTWGEVSADAETLTAANDAELSIAEFTGGIIDESTLKANLAGIFKFNSLLISSGDFSSAVVSRSASQALTHKVAFG